MAIDPHVLRTQARLRARSGAVDPTDPADLPSGGMLGAVPAADALHRLLTATLRDLGSPR